MTKAMMTAFATAALAMTVNGAFAATTIHGTKSNSSSYKACVDSGGTVKKVSKDENTCTPKKK